MARFREGVTSGQFTAHHENAIKTRDGLERLIVWDNTILRSATGAVAGVASLGIDVTDHRNLEMQLLQSQKMESIGTLAGGVAHDFNNILTVILSCAAMLRMKKDDPKRTQMLIDQIDGAAHRAANLTSSLLAFSRKQQISPGRIDLNEVIARMHDFLERIIGEDVILSTRLHPAGVPVLADGGQLEQVMMNLASNARDAMPQGGTLTIETSIADVDRVVPEDGSTQKGAFALLRISDTGSGIPLQDQKRVFEPFFTTKEVGKGTGLGLSMAYGIIKQHNGWMSLDSEVGTGSSFSVYLPLVERGDEPVRAAQAPAPAGDGTVLLVEDDEQVLEANRAVLQSGGYTVLAARGGQEAIDIYRQHPDRIGLAVIDVVMPDMNGRQVYDQLTALNPTLMVLFTSGYTADLLDRKNLPQGCSFMQKPQPPQEFLRLVREILQPQAKR